MERINTRKIPGWLDRFFFSPGSDRWLSILRIGLGLQIILFCWSLRLDWNVFFSADGGPGLIGREVAEALLEFGTEWVPRLSWWTAPAEALGLSEQLSLGITWSLLLGAGFFLAAGLFSREAAITAWLLHLSAAKSADLFAYGMDNFTTIGLFYLMLSPLPDRLSADFRLRSLKPKAPDLQTFFRRILQLHLCLVYFFGGITKSAGLGWWNGMSVWRALVSPPFDHVPPEVLVSWQALLPAMAISVCLLEVSYPIFIWSHRTRRLWLGAVIGVHLAIGGAMGLFLFSMVMIVLNLAAFGPSPQSEDAMSASSRTGLFLSRLRRMRTE